LQIGGTGRLADIEKAGASGVSDVTGAAQRAGFGADTGVSGGIINQRQQLARSQAEANLAGGKQEFLTAEANALSPIGQASSNFKQAQFQDQIVNRETAAGNQVWSGFNSLLEQLGNRPEAAAKIPVANAASGTTPPKDAKPGQVWKNATGVKYKFVNNKWKSI
jgi:hypothetical protein